MRIESSWVDYGVREAYSERLDRRDHLQAEARDAAPKVSVPASGAAELGAGDVELDDPRLILAKLIVEALLGGDFSQFKQAIRRAVGSGAVAQAGRGLPQWSVTVSHEEIYEERESLAVKARGAVRTAEGKEIQFDAEFTLARSFRAESGSVLRAGNAEMSDPLFLDTGSGQALLVRDANGDGNVSNSGELFGASSGDGFSELANFDADGNGWIDAGDPVFAKLRLSLGDGSFQALESLGIGALSTSGAAGEFHYKNEANELTAVVRRTGVYLTEDGRAGAMRQIDLAA